MKNVLKAGLVAPLLLMAASCTISEPSVQEGEASALQLKGLSAYGIMMMKVDYDAQGRVVKINYDNDMVYELTYSDSGSVPSRIVEDEYDYDYDSDSDKEVRKVIERTEWTNIKSDGHGHIASFDCNEVYYGYGDMNPQKTSSKKTYTYDSEGHLLTETETPDNEAATMRIYTWSDGLLTGRSEASGSENSEWGKFEYCDVENIHRQWDPNNEVVGPLAITGLFGVAPSRFFKKEICFDGYEQISQYAYTLLPNGLIDKSRFYDSEDGEIVFNFVYEKR